MFIGSALIGASLGGLGQAAAQSQQAQMNEALGMQQGAFPNHTHTISGGGGMSGLTNSGTFSNIYMEGNIVSKGTISADKFITTNKEKSMIKSFKEYVSEHKQIIFTLGFVLLLDHLLLQGALKSKVQDVLNSILDRTKDALKPKATVTDIKVAKE